MMPRFVLNDTDNQTRISDQEHHLTFAFLAEGMMGVPSANLELAKKVVDFLNSLPPEETLLYPHNRK